MESGVCEERKHEARKAVEAALHVLTLREVLEFCIERAQQRLDEAEDALSRHRAAADARVLQQTMTRMYY